jgi:hypothetical protein
VVFFLVVAIDGDHHPPFIYHRTKTQTHQKSKHGAAEQFRGHQGWGLER